MDNTTKAPSEGCTRPSLDLPAVEMTPARAGTIFWAIAVVYAIVWTLMPFCLEDNFRYDVIEMFFVGKEGVVSTYKHPALNSAVLEIVYQGLGRSGIAPYLLAQLCFMISGWTVWRLGRECLSPREALLGALCFYGYWGFFYKSLYYNHNVVLFPAWGCVTLFAFLSLKYGKLRHWVALGIAIGLGVQCKLTLLILVAAILLFMVVHPRARQHWRKIGPYLSTVVSLLIALPLIHWIIQSDFSCFRFPEVFYGMEKTLVNRLFSVYNDGILCLPVLLSSFVVLLSPLIGIRWRFRRFEKTDADDKRFARTFLLWVVFIPWILQLISVFFAVIPMEFGNYMQVFLFLGPALLMTFRARTDGKAVRRAWIFFGIVMVGFLVGHGVHVYRAHYITKRLVNYMFPGRELAEISERIWHERYDKPLPYVAGGWWFGGNVAIYGKDRPTVHATASSMTLDDPFPLSNWSTDDLVRRHGGLVFWDMNTKRKKIFFEADPLELLQKRFKRFEILPEPIMLTPVAKTLKEPIMIGVAVIPPDETIRSEPIRPAPWYFFRPDSNR